mgnify:CR=1 FL=1
MRKLVLRGKTQFACYTDNDNGELVGGLSETRYLIIIVSSELYFVQSANDKRSRIYTTRVQLSTKSVAIIYRVFKILLFLCTQYILQMRFN